jgi:tetratricopeptide (TPR) repeat protein
MGKDKRTERKLARAGHIALFVALILASASAQTVRHHRVQVQDPDAAILSDAETNIGKQDYASAEPLLKKYLAAHADNYTAWYDLGFVYHALGRNDEAIAAYQKSIAAKSDVFASNLNLGLILAETGNPGAVEYLRAATRLNPTSNPAQGHKRASIALGRVLESSNPDQSLEAYEQASAVDPKDPEPHLLAGSLLEKQQKADEAEKEYQQALAAAPDSSDALIALSNLYMRQKKFAEAQTPLKKLVSVHPNDASAHFQLGRMLAISGKNDDAIVEMEAGLKLDPADSKAQRDLADMYADAKRFEDASRLYSALLTTHPDDADLHVGLGRVLLKQRKFAAAEQELIKAVKLKPEWGEAYGELAVAANENKDYALAIKAADMRAKYIPENPMSYFLRATAYDHLRDAQNAAKYYHQFLAVAGGKYPDEEWKATHRLIAIEPKK